jgi:hypothetical protein
MTEDRPASGGEQRGHVARVPGRHVMPDEIDPAVDLVQSAVAQSELDLIGGDGALQQL